MYLNRPSSSLQLHRNLCSRRGDTKFEGFRCREYPDRGTGLRPTFHRRLACFSSSKVLLCRWSDQPWILLSSRLHLQKSTFLFLPSNHGQLNPGTYVLPHPQTHTFFFLLVLFSIKIPQQPHLRYIFPVTPKVSSRVNSSLMVIYYLFWLLVKTEKCFSLQGRENCTWLFPLKLTVWVYWCLIGLF